MKASGVVRRFDSAGRISIPVEIRKSIFSGISSEGMPMEIFMEKDAIVLKRYMPEEKTDLNNAMELLEKAAEELENLYGRETGLSDEIREFLDSLT